MGLRMPHSKHYDIRRRYQTDSERVEAVVKEWLAHHPAPSWKRLARALYERGDLRALQRLYGKYLAGMHNDLTCVISVAASCVSLKTDRALEYIIIHVHMACVVSKCTLHVLVLYMYNMCRHVFHS